MRLKNDIFELVVNQLCRRVIVTFYLIANHLYLLVYLRLWIDAVKDNVCQQFCRFPKIIPVNGRIESCIFLIRESIQFSSEFFQSIDDLKGTATCGAFKSDMFTEMCHSLFPRQFMTRTGGNLITTVHHRRG